MVCAIFLEKTGPDHNVFGQIYRIVQKNPRNPRARICGKYSYETWAKI